MGDLAQRDEFEVFILEMQAFATDMFRSVGRVGAFAVVLATRDPDGKDLAEPAAGFIFARDFDSESSKNDYADAIKKLVVMTRAIGVVFVSESWIVEAASREDLGGLPPSEHPDRKEILHITAEHIKQRGARMWVCSIRRKRDGKGVLGKWAETKGEFTGRFVELLNRERFS